MFYDNIMRILDADAQIGRWFDKRLKYEALVEYEENCV